jgi:hypothetical protein
MQGGKAHINTVESEFPVFRLWNATFKGYSKKKIHLYIARYNYLRNTRHLDRVRCTIAMLMPTANT